MAAPFRSRYAHNDAQAYSSVTTSQAAYPAVHTSLHHADSGYDTSGYEPREHPHFNARYQMAVDHRQFDMLPPPSSTHASWQALHDYAQSYASQHGYALSINTTAKNRSRIKLACVCFGQPKNTHKLTAETRVRKNRASYKTGCRMWIEGRKQEDGTWLLRVGEAKHNHAGRPSEGWAVQRKRTWGVVGGRVGVGGVTAKEELAKISNTNKTVRVDEDEDNAGEEGREIAIAQHADTSHSLERGGLVWKIVEQEMLRKGESNQGRDRGVGRTVEVLQAVLPGIHIFKRDIYNIRAQIKRARKAAGQQVGEGVNSDDEAEAQAHAGAEKDTAEDEEDETETTPIVSIGLPQRNIRPPAPPTVQIRDFALDPTLTIPNPMHPPKTTSAHEALSASSAEVEQLRKEVAQLKKHLSDKTKEVMEKNIVIAGLRSQLDYMTSMAMLPN
ncbi:hypothetical protein EK21DRAFT_76826 [Setomelanomma holmii]|uniref:FAR1 domain-containing protein n=1 Tax=Setomelanomma holmii TaxID=210430 RepID=A0A9P4H0B7_9PLEO|nr:hypothetical protein EK21DRAFT_76826 [Setomelanomma holmii]